MGCGCSTRPGHGEQDEEPKQDYTQQSSTSPRVTESEKFDYFQNLALFAHNHFREIHQSPIMKLNSGLCQLALRLSQRMAKSEQLDQCAPEDRMYNGEICGENLYWKEGSAISIVGDEAVKSWYSEKKHYDFQNPGPNPEASHFTQFVWADSREMGVAYTESQRGVAVVAVYDPAGNMDGEFDKNVHPEKDHH